MVELTDIQSEPRTKKNFKFPMFLDMCKFTLERYWHEVLTLCAKGTFPKGIRYDSNQNLINIDGCKESYVLPKDLLSAWKMCYTSFKKVGLGSTSIVIPSPIIHNIETEWKKIRSKYIKDTLILKYVSLLAKKYNLKASETKQLLGLLQLASQLSAISPTNVIMKNGEISRIDGLLFNSKKRCFSFPLSKSYDEENIEPAVQTKKRKRLDIELDKYLRHLSVLNNSRKKVMRSN